MRLKSDNPLKKPEIRGFLTKKGVFRQKKAKKRDFSGKKLDKCHFA